VKINVDFCKVIIKVLEDAVTMVEAAGLELV